MEDISIRPEIVGANLDDFTWRYKFEAWNEKLGSKPKSLLDTADYSKDYDMDQMHILELENGKYATVIEKGCSCYDSSDAEIEVHPNKEKALEIMDVYVRENERDKTN